ncbi:hypothetical protein, partial [Nocardia neocaledoniensis]|uniref:hypothetical protein n=1 Tax=Nocardia neocaledoniensis TaxID=236511 RepID=UPI001C993F61
GAPVDAEPGGVDRAERRRRGSVRVVGDAVRVGGPSPYRLTRILASPRHTRLLTGLLRTGVLGLLSRILFLRRHTRLLTGELGVGVLGLLS